MTAYTKYSREKRPIENHPSPPPLLLRCQYQHSDEDECERDGLLSVFHLHLSILVDFSNNLYREVMSDGKKKKKKKGEGSREHRQPCLHLQALSFPPTLLCFLNRMTLIKDCWHNSPCVPKPPLGHGLVFNLSACFAGVKPEDVAAVSSLFPFWILLTLRLWNHI